MAETPETDVVELSEPSTGGISVEAALAERRSRREYKDQPLTLEQLSQLLWAAQGETSQWGGRTAPSAGATYPLELYAVVGDVEGLQPGVYRHIPSEHRMVKTVDGDVREDLAAAALGQEFVAEAPVVFVIAAVYERTTQRYGDRGIMYVHMEAGHAGQNIYLQAESLGLGTVAVGAFNLEQVSGLLQLPDGQEPVYLFPAGVV